MVGKLEMLQTTRTGARNLKQKEDSFCTICIFGFIRIIQ